MTMARHNLVVQDGAGNIINGASVEVRAETVGTPLATLKPNRDGSGTLANPFTASDGADAGFYVAGGAYKVRVYTGPSGAPTFERIWRYVPIGLLGESDSVSIDTLSIHGADVASASTINLEAATGDLRDLTGTTTVTAITLSEGHERTVRTTGALILTHGASLVLPYAANILTAAGDFFVFRGYAAGVVRCVGYQPFSARVAKDAISVNGSDIASASTINLETATGDCVDVTGTTAITAITLSAGHERTVRFTGILTLTHGASLVIPGAVNFITAAGDFVKFRGYAAGVVRVVSIQLANAFEEVTSTVTAASPFAISTGGSGVVWNQAAIPRAGLWEIGGNAGIIKSGGTTPTYQHMHCDHNITGATTIQTSPGGGSTQAQHLTSNQENGWINGMPTRWVRTTGAATVNFVGTADFTGGTCGLYGTGFARRVGY